MEASSLFNLGKACQQLMGFDNAGYNYDRSLELYQRAGDVNYQAYLLGSPAKLSIARIHHAQARQFIKPAASLDASRRTAGTNRVLEQALAELCFDDYPNQCEPERSRTLSRAIEHLERVIALSEAPCLGRSINGGTGSHTQERSCWRRSNRRAKRRRRAATGSIVRQRSRSMGTIDRLQDFS